MDSPEQTIVQSLSNSATCWREEPSPLENPARFDGRNKLIQLLPFKTKDSALGRFLDPDATNKRTIKIRWLGLVVGAAVGCFFGIPAIILGGATGFFLTRYLDMRVFLQEYDFSFLCPESQENATPFRCSRRRKLPVIADEDIEHLMSRQDTCLGDDLLDLLDLFSLTREQMLMLVLHLVERRDLDDILVKLRAHTLKNKVRNYTPWLIRLRFILNNIHRRLNERYAIQEQECVIQWREDFLARFIEALDNRIAKM